jgi:hypothetical protein
MSTPPNGFFRCFNLAGTESIGFHCPVCKLVVYRGIESRGIFHCGAWEKAPWRTGDLPRYQIQPAGVANSFVGNVGKVPAVFVGFD